jgi:hypothetical protein
MIKQYAGARVQPVCSSVVRDEPLCRTLRYGVGAAPQHVQHAAKIIGRHGFQAHAVTESEPRQIREATDLRIA